MRKTLIVLTPLLLAGCVKQSGSYYVSDARDHAITVRAEQEYVWDQNITLSLVVSHFPGCQRAMTLQKVPKADLVVELFSSGDNVYTVRSGDELKQFETDNCTELATPAPNAIGEAVGVFRLVEGQSEKLDFENTAAAAAAPAPATE
jgi:hypothetical protein